ncbi:iron-containing alcohol dehydrogenase [Nocardioides carbamazepini]|uniref:iron-containing alcohol dehydrogenase n=1 Tax=Nocardioides carbamazepini TaxID=2854259 RepID=UPI002149C7D0|nr:iron-containing alcohol dehydrogenase [Nocardioides carbamazepini]MCR1782366.1 iron-containing alcohol dehydrogenase [Nocardioides carbamazepini]
MRTGVYRHLNPLAIHYGAGVTAEHLDSELTALGASRAVIVTADALLGSPAMAYLVASSPALVAERLVTVRAHAPFQDVLAIARLVRASSADAVVALGGGSAIDAAKLGSLAASGADEVLHPGDLSALAARPPAAVVASLAVPTTLSAAELCGAAGYADPDSRTKVGMFVDAMNPAAVFYDPVVTEDTPEQLWTSTGIRALDHAVEGLLAGTNPMSDELAAAAVPALVNGLRRYGRGDRSSQVRLELQIGAWKAYNAPRESGAGLSHVMGKAIGSVHGIPHGMTSCVLLPSVLRHYAAHPAGLSGIERLRAGLAIDALGPRDILDAAADHIEQLVGELALPTSLRTFGVLPEALAAASAAVAERTGVAANDVLRIYQAAADR